MKKKVNIPIFITDTGCKNRCSFCNQKHITGKQFIFDLEAISSSIEIALSTLCDNQSAEIAFFGGSFTGLPIEEMQKLLDISQKYVNMDKRVTGIRFSTRPDYFSAEIFEVLSLYKITTIELGVQSFDDKVLAKNCRGYENGIVEKISREIQQRGIALGLQLMAGLYGANLGSDFKSIDSLCKIKPNFMRYYPTLVIKDTELENLYKLGDYIPYTLKQAVVAGMYAMKMCAENDIEIIRMGLQSSVELRSDDIVLAGPFHNAYKECVYSEIYYTFFKKMSEKSKVIVPMKIVSRIKGHKKMNSLRLPSFEFEVVERLVEDIEINGVRYTFQDILQSIEITL